YLVERGCCECAHVGQCGDEALEIGHDHAHLGLLQHDLRQPHPVRRAWMLPGQVVASGDVEPLQQALGIAVDGCPVVGGGADHGAEVSESSNSMLTPSSLAPEISIASASSLPVSGGSRLPRSMSDAQAASPGTSRWPSKRRSS